MKEITPLPTVTAATEQLYLHLSRTYRSGIEVGHSTQDEKEIGSIDEGFAYVSKLLYHDKLDKNDPWSTYSFTKDDFEKGLMDFDFYKINTYHLDSEEEPLLSNKKYVSPIYKPILKISGEELDWINKEIGKLNLGPNGKIDLPNVCMETAYIGMRPYGDARSALVMNYVHSAKRFGIAIVVPNHRIGEYLEDCMNNETIVTPHEDHVLFDIREGKVLGSVAEYLGKGNRK